MRRLGRLSNALFLVLMLFPGVPAAHADLKAPWELPGFHPGPLAKPPELTTCAEPPAPVRQISGVAYYTDPSHSIVDPELRRQHDEAVRPITEFVRTVARMGDAYLLSGKAEAADCAAQWLLSWAKAEALLGEVDREAGYEQQWFLAGLAFNYLKIRKAAVANRDRADAITGWLDRLALVVIARNETGTGPSSRNNHANWAGLAVGLTGIARDNPGRWSWGIARFRKGVDQIQPSGGLPLELARRAKAFHYHHFALIPLIVLAEFAQANSLDLYGYANGAIHLTARLLLRALEDPAVFSALVGGQAQDPLGATDTSWLEIYHTRFRDRAAGRYLLTHRPQTDPQLASDMTALFGAPLAP